MSSEKRRKKIAPCVLAVGGLDPGGGAGILADSRAAARAGAFGCGVAAVLTFQSTSRMVGSHIVGAREVIAQCTQVAVDQDVRAIKLGALGSIANARAVASFLAKYRDVPVVVDPVTAPTRGRGDLLEKGKIGLLAEIVFPRATVVTVNALEARALTGRALRTPKDIDAAMIDILEFGARAVLLKGGHLDERSAVDRLVIRTEGRSGDLRHLTLTSPRLRIDVHGGGCVLASLIAGRLALRSTEKTTDRDIVGAVRWAKKVHHAALAGAVHVGGDARVLLA